MRIIDRLCGYSPCYFETNSCEESEWRGGLWALHHWVPWCLIQYQTSTYEVDRNVVTRWFNRCSEGFPFLLTLSHTPHSSSLFFNSSLMSLLMALWILCCFCTPKHHHPSLFFISELTPIKITKIIDPTHPRRRGPSHPSPKVAPWEGLTDFG